MLDPPSGIELPSKGFDFEDNGYIEPVVDGSKIDIVVKENSERLRRKDCKTGPIPTTKIINVTGIRNRYGTLKVSLR